MLTTPISYQLERLVIRLLIINQKKFHCTETKLGKKYNILKKTLNLYVGPISYSYRAITHVQWHTPPLLFQYNGNKKKTFESPIIPNLGKNFKTINGKPKSWSQFFLILWQSVTKYIKTWSKSVNSQYF